MMEGRGSLFSLLGGIGSSLSATGGLAACCGGAFGATIAGASAVSLRVFDQSRVIPAFLYVALLVNLLGLLISHRRHHKSGALLLSLAAAGVLLIPYHGGASSSLFSTTFSTGVWGLVLAAGVDVFLVRWQASGRTSCPARTANRKEERGCAVAQCRSK